MYFLDTFLSEETQALRDKIVAHDLWKKIADGTLEKEKLQVFALQDYWLVNQATRIDTLTIASLKNSHLQNFLIDRISRPFPKQTLIDFGIGVGLTEEDFIHITPIAGCMALTTFFYWMINYTSDAEKVAAITTSVSVFSDICMQIYKPLMNHYHLTQKQVEFFSMHEENEGNVKKISDYIENTFTTNEEKKLIKQAIHISHEYELMFYNTILNKAII